MSAGIEVIGARLGPPREPMPLADDEPRPVELVPIRVLTIVFLNTAKKALHVWTSPRRLSLDSSTQTLRLQLAEDDSAVASPQELVGFHLTAPNQVTVPVGEPTAADIVLPGVLTEARDSHEGLGLDFQTTTVDKVRRLAIRLAVSEIPFQVVTGIPTEEALQLLIDTGEVVDIEVAVEDETLETS